MRDGATLSLSDPQAMSEARPQIQGYQVLEEVGRGGMGVVYRVQDPKFGRELAVKVMLGGNGRDALRARFLEEARISGQLQHPGVAPVHDLGRLADGRPFFSMKLIEGETLAALLKKRPFAGHELLHFLRVFERIVQTLAYAHEQNVIHRDLKPHNVMVGAFGEVQVMDWGLAKRLANTVAERQIGASIEPTADTPDTDAATAPWPAGRHTSLTSTVSPLSLEGDRLGTPAYMSPEQARGEIQHLTAQCDVFGLGAILCEILTGTPPFAADSGQAAIERAQRADLADPLRRLNSCGCDAELIALATHCLAPLAGDRPDNAGHVARRMAAYLDSVQERWRMAELSRTAAEAKALEERKRRRITLALAAVLLLLLTGGGAFGAWYYRHQAELETQDVLARREMEDALGNATAKLSDLELQLATPDASRSLVNDGGGQWTERLDAVHAELSRIGASLDRLSHSPGVLGDEYEAIGRRLEAHVAGRDLALRLEDAQGHGRLAAGPRKISAAATLGPQASPLRDTLLYRAEIEDAFRQSLHYGGVTLDATEAVDAAATIRQSPIAHFLLSALDHWALLTRDDVLRGRLLEVARLADPDPLRERLRSPEVWRDAESLLVHIQAALDEGDRVPTSLLTPLFFRYRLLGGKPDPIAGRLSARAVDDFWLLVTLGESASEPGEQIGYFRAAAALRPRSPLVHQKLGQALSRAGKHDEALRAARFALTLSPDYLEGRYALANAVLAAGDAKKSVQEFKQCVEFSAQTPDGVDPNVYYGLGSAYFATGEYELAEQALREALKGLPNDAYTLNNLGRVRQQLGDEQGATELYRQAIAADPTFALAHHNLGEMYAAIGGRTYDAGDEEQGRKWFQQAEEQFRLAVEHDPGFAPAYTDLGIILRAQGKLAEAITQQRTAVRLAPHLGLVHYNLALALLDHKDEEGEAKTHFREAFRLDPAVMNHYLHAAGGYLVAQQKFDEARQHGQRAVELLDDNEAARKAAEDYVKRCEDYVELADWFPKFVADETTPTPANIPLPDVAAFCWQFKYRYALAARLYADAFAKSPEIADEGNPTHRYAAACCAVLAGTDQNDEDVSNVERGKLRSQALAWLREELGDVSDRKRSGGSASALDVLTSWRLDERLAPVREADQLAMLPAEEQQHWRLFWSAVAQTLQADQK